MQVVVTGGAGFIGSHLVERLLSEGHEVTVLDDLSSGSPENLPTHSRLRFLRGAVQDPECCEAALRGARQVFHLAGCPSVPQALAHPEHAVASTVLGTQVVLETARRHGVRRVVYASSSAVYGPRAPAPQRETHPLDPATPYAATRLSAEQLARAWHRSYGLPSVGLRFFNIYGPRQRNAEAVVPRFIRAALRGEPAELHGGGRSSRDFVFVDDAVEATLCAARAPHVADGRCFNVARGQEVSVAELHARLAELMGQTIPPAHAPRRAGDVSRSCGDPRAAARALEFVSNVTLDEGLRQTVAWFQRRPQEWRAVG
ncbi:MAG: NAD-dependent epimerase/dehydratase family protein [Alphaproteobacteria bacterium]|nr:NAD-dependent epimerase/dehydratase family protein [Alphaproteobacteria bacterium]